VEWGRRVKREGAEAICREAVFRAVCFSLYLKPNIDLLKP
jgi:hypothetical protein